MPAVLSMALLACGDLLAQWLSRSRNVVASASIATKPVVGGTTTVLDGRPAAWLSMERIGRAVAWGSVLSPLISLWFILQEYWFPGTGRLVLFKKIVADQLVWSPPIVVRAVCACGGHALAVESLSGVSCGSQWLYFALNGWMTTGKVSSSASAATAQLLPALRVNWCLWPFVHRTLSASGGPRSVCNLDNRASPHALWQSLRIRSCRLPTV